MQFSRRSVIVAMAATAVFPARLAAAQAWPSRPITLLVPFPPGPAVDLVARQVAQRLTLALKQPVVVENRVGANGTIASAAVARAEPDGYTLLIGTAGTHATAVHLTPNLPYDPVKDFTPIVAAVEPVTCLAISSSLPVKSVHELIEYAKTKPGELSYGSSGIGSVFHLIGEMFNRTAGLKINHVPYRGVAPALQDVIAGHIPMTFISLSNALPAAASGKVRILAVLEPERFNREPHIPSMSELVPGFRKPSSWFGFLGPAGMDRGIVTRLNAEMTKALNDPEIKDVLEKQGFSIIAGTSEEFGDLIRVGVDVYGELVKQAGVAQK